MPASLPLPRLTAAGITKSFGAVRALRGVSFELRAGEVHALIGENGAGKSTFTKICTGNLAPDSGELQIAADVINTFTPDNARALGIAAIYQQPLIFPHLSVAENIALDLERRQPLWKVDWSRRNKDAEKLLHRLGASIHPRRLAETLSMAEQQLVEIAKAIGAEAKILFMDEPTALLTDNEADNLFRIVRELREQGVGIVYISHRLEEVQSIADRITVLRDGQTIQCTDARGIDRSQLIGMMVGRAITSIYPKREIPLKETVLSVEHLECKSRGLHDVSFAVRSGEILGFAGLIGSGRTEVAESLFGLAPSTSGQIMINGNTCVVSSPRNAVALGMGYLPEDRRRHGLIMEMSVAENISMANLDAVSKVSIIDRPVEATLAESFVSRLRIKTAAVTTAAASLSGGNQQKVALARWLAINPRIMVLDEPTQGVDVGSKAEIHELIMRMAEDGMAIILISSDLPEIIGMCDRVAVFHNRTIAAFLDREQATQENIMSLAFGHALQTGSSSE